MIAVVVVGLGLVGWLAPAAGAFAFRSAHGSPYAVGGPSSSVAVGDFNGEGGPDLAVLLSDDTVAVLLGSGGGTFTPAPGSPIALGRQPGHDRGGRLQWR